MIKFFRILGIILLIPVAVFLFLILYATFTDYRPEKAELLKPEEQVKPEITDSSVFELLIWNLGYAGLDRNMDFFYDGGKQVRTSEEQVKTNFSAIKSYLADQDSVEIIMLQEIDVKSKRSYHMNQVMNLADEIKEYEHYFGKNYDVFFVPVPPGDPMGSVNSGLLSLTKFEPGVVERYSFPGQYAWPKRLFMLDRCFLVMRFPVSNGKQLVVINTHNEAYDDGSIRDTQMKYLKDFLLSEFEKGNYIIAGGDWNQCPPHFEQQFNGEVFDSINNKGIDPDYLPGDWHWAYDNSIPTNRRVDITYTKGTTKTTVIDFYLLSPNMKMLSVKASDLKFEHSDHHPVFLKVALD